MSKFHSRFIINIIIAIILTAATSSCGGSSRDSHNDNYRDISIQKESQAYKSGYDEAKKMLDENLPKEQIHSRLLDTRARIYLIEQRHNKVEAANYQQGFVDGIKENNPTLASEIF